MDEPLAELAAYSCSWYEVPDTDLVRLTAAARAAGHRWDAIAAACDNGPGLDIPAVIRRPAANLGNLATLTAILRPGRPRD